MCHMIADTHAELVEMADKIGVARKWIQNPNRYTEHFDIALSKRKLAIQHGARPVTFHEFGELLTARKALAFAATYRGLAASEPEKTE